MLSASALRWTWISAAIALFLAANFAYGLWKARRQTASSRRWPVAQGEILSCRVKVPAVHSSDDDDADCRVEIRYRYTVAGKDHESSHIDAGREAMMTPRRRGIGGEISGRCQGPGPLPAR
jgi:hypothetical protein